MFHTTPERLLNQHYLSLSSPFQLFQHTINQCIPTHWHEFFELAFVTGGTGTHILNGVPQRLSKGMMFLLTPADFHEIVPDPGETITLYDIIFTEQFVRYDVLELLFDERNELVHTCRDEEYAVFKAECERMREEQELEPLGASTVLQGALERLMIDLLRRVRLQAGETLGEQERHILHPSIRRALIYLQHHFRDDISLGSVSSYCGFSPGYFSELFRKQTGVTFQSYVSQLRLQFAQSLLRTTVLPITEVCFASGFRTMPHFERAFKQQFGKPPRMYRSLQQ